PPARDPALARRGQGRQAAVRGLHRPRTADRAAAQEARAGCGAVRGLSIRAGEATRRRRATPAAFAFPAPAARAFAMVSSPGAARSPLERPAAAVCHRPIPAPAAPSVATAAASLRDWLGRHQRVFVLTGAGCSTASGIPDYRDANGDWKRTPPITLQALVGSDAAYRRYWARSSVGWPRFLAARPNRAHHALAEFERRGRVSLLLTQNVDGLHQRAGSRDVLDLHGRLDAVVCLGCGERTSREAVQGRIEAANPGWHAGMA